CNSIDVAYATTNVTTGSTTVTGNSSLFTDPVQGLCSCTGFRTQTPGGWGTKPEGGNPGMYLKQNFAGAFPAPNYLTIGGACAGGFSLQLTSASAIQDFLPSGGTPAVLTQNYVNPGGSLSNTFAGQLVAATLSLGFDVYDPSFGSNPKHLSDLVIGS